MKTISTLMLALVANLLMSFTLHAPTATRTIYDFQVQDVLGSTVPLSQYKGQVLLVVNVANKCILSPQYQELQSLYDEYSDKGLTVLAFPSSNFSEEEKDGQSFRQACLRKYAITFPMFSQVVVKGEAIHPLYKFLTSKSENGNLEAPVKMNFQKFLIDKSGKVVASFPPRTSVKDKKVIQAIKAALEQNP